VKYFFGVVLVLLWGGWWVNSLAMAPHGQIINPPSGGGGSGCTTGTSTNLQQGNGTGGCSDSEIAAANVPLLNATNTFTGTNNNFVQVTSLGTTSTDSGNLGSELTASGTTTSTGWTGSYNSYSNGASNTSPLTYAPTISSGSHYQVVITVSGYSAGSISITFGGVTLAGMSSNTTQTIGPKTTSTAALVITPTSTFVGTVTASIKLISAISTYAFAAKDSTGAYSYIALQPLASLHNYFIGGGGEFNTAGSSNSAQGYSALFNNTTGSNNSAQGYSALFNNTTGSNNSAQGYQALYNNTTGGNNSAQGTNALYNNTTGSNNSAQGYQALYSNTTGSYNSAQGYQALNSNTTGSGNSAQGYYALNSNTTGNYNSAQGYQAGFGTSSTNANTIGSDNTFIGYESAPGSTTQQTFMTVIGASATATCSYCVSLGRSGTTANSSDVVIENGQFTVSSGTGFPALPTASSYPRACAWVQDASTTPTYLGAATGGGTTVARVCSDGTGWFYH
jgi:trimeric autotransporter adhesin